MFCFIIFYCPGLPLAHQSPHRRCLRLRNGQTSKLALRVKSPLPPKQELLGNTPPTETGFLSRAQVFNSRETRHPRVEPAALKNKSPRQLQHSTIRSRCQASVISAWLRRGPCVTVTEVIGSGGKRRGQKLYRRFEYEKIQALFIRQ